MLSIKKFLMTCICACLLVSCGDTSNSNTHDNKPEKTETYKILAYPYTPFVIQNGKNDLTGMEIDILQAVAKNQGISFHFFSATAQTKWDVLFNLIESKQSDVLAAGMYANDERRARFAVSDPYMHSQFAFLVARGVTAHSFADLKGKRVVVFANTIADHELRAAPESKNMTVIPVKVSLYEGIKKVARGEADAMYGDEVVLNYYANQFRKNNLMVSVNRKEHAQQRDFTFLINKENTRLLTKINAGLAAIQANGELDKIKNKWLHQ